MFPKYNINIGILLHSRLPAPFFRTLELKLSQQLAWPFPVVLAFIDFFILGVLIPNFILIASVVSKITCYYYLSLLVTLQLLSYYSKHTFLITSYIHSLTPVASSRSCFLLSSGTLFFKLLITPSSIRSFQVFYSLYYQCCWLWHKWNLTVGPMLKFDINIIPCKFSIWTITYIGPYNRNLRWQSQFI